MNTQEAIKILRNTAWLGTNEDREKTEQAVEVVAEALEQEPKMVHRETLEQVMWERDVAIEQLKELGYGLGEKIRTDEALQQDTIHCKDCKFIRWYEDEEYYYCALEDRPNRNWSVDETDFCSWAERQEPKREEKAKTLFMNLYNCEKFENLSDGFIYMKIPKCSIYDEIGREVIVNCVRQDNFECCFTNAFEQVEWIKGE